MKLVILSLTAILLSLAPAAAQVPAQVPAQPPAPPTAAVADFKLTAQPENVSVARGATTAVTVKIEPVFGFRGKVQLLSSLLYGTSTTFKPAVVESSATTSTLTIAPGPSALRGSFVMTITGVGPGVSHTITLPVRIR
jgi:hypothetical protein